MVRSDRFGRPQRRMSSPSQLGDDTLDSAGRTTERTEGATETTEAPYPSRASERWVVLDFWLPLRRRASGRRLVAPVFREGGRPFREVSVNSVLPSVTFVFRPAESSAAGVSSRSSSTETATTSDRRGSKPVRLRQSVNQRPTPRIFRNVSHGSPKSRGLRELRSSLCPRSILRGRVRVFTWASTTSNGVR